LTWKSNGYYFMHIRKHFTWIFFNENFHHQNPCPFIQLFKFPFLTSRVKIHWTKKKTSQEEIQTHAHTQQSQTRLNRTSTVNNILDTIFNVRLIINLIWIKQMAIGLEEISSELTATLGVNKNEDGTFRHVALIFNVGARYENVVGNYEVVDEGRRSHCLTRCQVTCSSAERRTNWGKVTWRCCYIPPIIFEFSLGIWWGEWWELRLGMRSKKLRENIELTLTVCMCNENVGKELHGILFGIPVGYTCKRDWSANNFLGTQKHNIIFSNIFIFYCSSHFLLLFWYCGIKFECLIIDKVN